MEHPQDILRGMAEGEGPDIDTLSEEELLWEIVKESGRGSYSGRLGDFTVGVTETITDERNERI